MIVTRVGTHGQKCRFPNFQEPWKIRENVEKVTFSRKLEGLSKKVSNKSCRAENSREHYGFSNSRGVDID